MSRETTPVVQVGATIPVELAEQVRALAVKAERSMSAEVRLALRAWVESANNAELREAA